MTAAKLFVRIMDLFESATTGVDTAWVRGTGAVFTIVGLMSWNQREIYIYELIEYRLAILSTDSKVLLEIKQISIAQNPQKWENLKDL